MQRPSGVAGPAIPADVSFRADFVTAPPPPESPMQRLPRIVTPLLVVALCALVVWWVTRLMPGTPIPIPPAAPIDAAAGNGRLDAVVASARLFGSRKPGVLSDNVRPLGVVADASGRGSVIVSVDGQAAKVYRVGDTLDGRLVTAIRADEIELEAGGARQVFRLPPARATATGLTILGGESASAAVPSMAPAAVAPDSSQAPPAMAPPVTMAAPPPMASGSTPQPPSYSGAPPVVMQPPPNIPDAATMMRRGRPVPVPAPADASLER